MANQFHKTEIHALVFDIDGTLLDTREYILSAYEYSLQKNGVPVPDRSQIAAQIGHRIEEIYSIIAPNTNLEKLISDHIEYQINKKHLIKSYNGALETVRAIRKEGPKIVLWTGRRAHVVETLRYAGFTEDTYDMLVDASMVSIGKPNPEGMILGLDYIGVLPYNSIMVGDAAVDIEAGKNAKSALTVGVTGGFGTREELINAGADYIVDSLAEILNILEIK